MGMAQIERDYMADSEVDKHNLDAEWTQNPNNFMYWAERAADAKAERMNLEENLKVIKAETKKDLDLMRAQIDSEVRAMPQRFSLEKDKKPTENAITSAIILDERYIKVDADGAGLVKGAWDEYVAAVRDEDILQSATKAMAMKSSSIDGLTTLFTRNYYPRVQKVARDSGVAEGQAEQKAVLGKAMVRRRKPV